MPPPGTLTNDACTDAAQAPPGSLPGFAVLRCGGGDAGTFLHGQFTCDVAGLPPRRWTWGAYCNAKGRVIADFVLWREADDWLLLLPASLIEGVARRLRMYVLRATVTLSVETSQRVVMGFAVPTVGLPAHPPAGEVVQSAALTLLGLSGGRTLALVPPQQIAALASWASAPEHWSAQCIRHGEPWVTGATQEAFVPQMLNLERLGGVSFTKGCYPGQEIVARSQHLGEVKRRLAGYQLAVGAVPAAGAALFATSPGEPVGTVVSAARSGEGAVLLAVCQTAVVGQPLRLADPDASALQPLPVDGDPAGV